jgi:hypothetical protein
MAAFDAPYPPCLIWPNAASLAMNTIAPPPSSFITGIAAWVAAIAENRTSARAMRNSMSMALRFSGRS